jgi:hypothetical protein
LPADAAIDGHAPIARGHAVETLARAISLIPKPTNQKSQISDFKSQTSDIKSEIALPSENGRLIVASRRPTPNLSGRENGSRFTSINTSGAGRLARTQQSDSEKGKSSNIAAKEPGPSIGGTREGSQRNVLPGFDISEGAWLFRTFGGESHQVDRLTIIGGERIVYHLNEKGQVDFVEASLSDRSASSDRFSSVAEWQERIPIEDLQQRLARVRVNVGRIEKIEPVAFSTSSRVTEVEVTGDESSARLRRPQIRAALGLKEYLFVVDRETDARGQVVAFVFTGRGWGHGVGMCQTGAYGLAKDGYSYTAILQKYYTGVKVQKIY